MDRIEMIGLVNPEWAVQISTFLEIFPEFNKYRMISSMTTKPVSDNQWWEPKTLFEHCIYYPCMAGVRYTYAIEQFKIIVTFLRSGDWMTICRGLSNFLTSNNVQQKKKQIYWDIFTWMNNNNVNNETLTPDHVEIMKNGVKGLGPGFIGSIRETFTDSTETCQYTDIKYVKSFIKVYGSKQDIKEKSEMWMSMGFGRVANSFMLQIFHHGHHCET